MRFTILATLFVAFISLTSFTANTNSTENFNNQLINKARNAAKSCIQNAREPHFEIVPSVNVVSACFADGFITEVTFYKVRKCTQTPCPRPAAELVAVVTLGCSNEVMSTVCGF